VACFEGSSKGNVTDVEGDPARVGELPKDLEEWEAFLEDPSFSPSLLLNLNPMLASDGDRIIERRRCDDSVGSELCLESSRGCDTGDGGRLRGVK